MEGKGRESERFREAGRESEQEGGGRQKTSESQVVKEERDCVEG